MPLERAFSNLNQSLLVRNMPDTSRTSIHETRTKLYASAPQPRRINPSQVPWDVNYVERPANGARSDKEAGIAIPARLLQDVSPKEELGTEIISQQEMFSSLPVDRKKSRRSRREPRGQLSPSQVPWDVTRNCAI